jgi:phage replication O-like protein O
MADVQLENGYCRIANEILERMAKIRLSPMQYRLLFVIWRYTYGFNRIEHDLSLSFLAEATGCDKRQIQRELKGLEERKIINQRIINGVARFISFNKNYDEWEQSIGETTIGEMTIGESTNPTIGETTNSTIGEITNQEKQSLKTSLKTNINNRRKRQKRVYDPDSTYMKMAIYLRDRIKAWKPDARAPDDLNGWADEFRKLCEIDKRSKEQIKNVIDFATSDSFWQTNILSAKTLREKFDTLDAQSSRRRGGHLRVISNSYEDDSYRKLVEAGL